MPKHTLSYDKQGNTLSLNPSGNCNFVYVSGLRSYLGQAELAVMHLLTCKPNRYDPYGYGYNPKPTSLSPEDKPPVYQTPQYSMYLFAQGSEDPVKSRPYAPQLMEVINEHKLGTVIDCGPSPNFMHNKKPGILYVWKLDVDACKTWWEERVLGEWKAWQEEKKKKEKPAVAPVIEPVAKVLKRRRCTNCNLLSAPDAIQCRHCGERFGPRRK